MIDYKVDAVRYRCPGCSEVWNNKEDALDCCPHSVTEGVTLYECSVCGKTYDELEESQSCCENQIDDAKVIYECVSCGEHYSEGEYSDEAEHAAKFCCVERREVEGYSCDNCSATFDSQWDAVKCCNEPVPSEGFACTCGEVYDDKDGAAQCCTS